jgi:hypothetical protein
MLKRLMIHREMQRGKENAFGNQDFICFSSKTKKVEDGLWCVLSESLKSIGNDAQKN